jgi:hypothetical protein
VGIRAWFGKDEIIGSKVLVCGLGSRFEGLVSNDSVIYARFYRFTTKTLFSTISDLTNAIGRQQYDIVHLFCDVPHTGSIADNEGNTISGTELIQECCNANVKLLWIASDNHPEGYIKNFKARGKRLNLVMTIVRNDPKFSDFLAKLLSRMFYGDTMPVAWTELAPQVPSTINTDSPGCIFFAGRGGVRLR